MLVKHRFGRAAMVAVLMLNNRVIDESVSSAYRAGGSLRRVLQARRRTGRWADRTR